MRSPLALIEVPRHDPRTGANTREWVVVRTAAAARGLSAYRVVFIRKPTPLDRIQVEATLSHSVETKSKQVHDLDKLLETSWKYGELCK
jgi:hypothetical protein